MTAAVRSLVVLLLLLTKAARGEPGVTWQKAVNGWQLRVTLKDALTEKQKKLIFSGFSTFSHVEVRIVDRDRTMVYIAECTIKYDMWEEKFDLLHFSERKRQNSLRTFDDYAAQCLEANIASPVNVQRLLKNQARLDVRLDIAQVSNAFTQDVRNWLIEQQSGVMRGLFAHMLGELKLYESLEIQFVPPPLDAAKRMEPIPFGEKGAGRG